MPLKGRNACNVEGDRGAGDREKRGAGRCTGDGTRGDGKGDPQGGGKREKRGKFGNIVQYFAIEKSKEAGANKCRAGTVIKGYGKWEV